MKKTILLLFITIVSTFGFSQVRNLSNIPQIQTKATSTAEVTPDKITLSIVLTERDSRGRKTLEELEQRLESVLKENNIDIKSQLKLVTLSSNFEAFFLRKIDVLKTKSFELEVNNAKLASQILRALEGKEIANVNLLKTEYSKLKELEIDLKAKAVLKAKEQASKMASALNQNLGKAIFISDLEINNVVGLFQNHPAAAEFRSNSIVNSRYEDLEIEFENIKVEASVTVHFELN